MLGLLSTLGLDVDRTQKTWGGAATFLVGIALVVALLYVPLTSFLLKLAIGVGAVILLSLGTLVLGTARRGV